MRPKPGQPTLDRTSGKAEGSRFENPEFPVVKAAFLLAKGGDGISNPDPKGRMAPADGWAERREWHEDERERPHYEGMPSCRQDREPAVGTVKQKGLLGKDGQGWSGLGWRCPAVAIRG